MTKKINGIAFTGRETMLTSKLKSAASKGYEYIGAGKVFSAAEELAAQKAAKVVKILPNIDANKAAASYALSHRTPKTALPEAIARSIDITI